ncbi:hypothetical protein [Streptomyces sp. S465]|uniref:hypothetical protein n=1 Tax=Streptomyces sp. S465 TaxID=2979468 RepID=UPI0022A88540|nr:hypothetical protein [Streptomyces sp. S465]WAP60368.1 hypothetical protein N6H00_38390 [Streptomyces sp. S465]
MTSHCFPSHPLVDFATSVLRFSAASGGTPESGGKNVEGAVDAGQGRGNKTLTDTLMCEWGQNTFTQRRVREVLDSPFGCDFSAFRSDSFNQYSPII